MKEFQDKLEKLEALLNELDLFIDIEDGGIVISDFGHSVTTNTESITRWDFERFRRESGGES
tara:strand:+ start:923 stop:1108 length:186 start_codon:yes stop_codon:yes gene_type:complete